MAESGRISRGADTVLEWAAVMIKAMLVVILVMTLVFCRVRVDGASMEDTLFDGDRLLVSWLMYQPEDGDIVICDSKALGKLIVKRVIAVGGQKVTVDYNAGTVAVDGEIKDEPYLKYHALDDMGGYDMEYYDPERGVFEYDVPEGEVFLMGDNRDHSTDSRYFGCVQENDIIGKAVFRFYSNEARIGTVN
jgi:signal peptidase I